LQYIRSLLFVPGHQERMLQKAFEVPADGVIIDLEDAVPSDQKQTAREAAGRWLAEAHERKSPLYRLVRVSSLEPETFTQDLDAIIGPGLDAICLPKVQTVDELQRLDWIVSEHEALHRDMTPGQVGFLVAIETALGLINAPALAAALPRNIGLMFGGEDFSSDIGLPLRREKEAREMLYARSALAIAAASVHIPAVDTIWADIRDIDGLREESLLARRLGFSAKTAIHPGQIEAINEVFSPDADEIEHARAIMAAVEAGGDGAIRHEGTMIDGPIVNRARRALALAEANEQRERR
jgi:citrate lyase subunit beta / citryl-CoA lyase